jgi:hypothetical protein
MRSGNRKFGCGVTLVELIITMVIGVTLILAVGTLIVGGQRAWRNTYASAHKKIKEDAQAITITFGSMGRRSNRNHTPTDLAHSGYVLYKVNGGNFTPAVPLTILQEVVSGDAVEFRYWNEPLDVTDSYKLLDVKKIATAYALFYLKDNELKVDYGPYDPPGGHPGAVVPAGSGVRNTVGVTTIVLAGNPDKHLPIDKRCWVSADPGGAFSHTTTNSGVVNGVVIGKGQGCVRINVILTDFDPKDGKPIDGETIQVRTSTMLRNIWPR